MENSTFWKTDMKISKKKIQELKPILKKEYGLELDGSDLENFAYKLVGYFDLLLKIYYREQTKGVTNNAK